MKIVIVGGGAIGRLFASFLVQGNNDVIIVDTDPKVVREIQENGVGLMGPQSEHPKDVTFLPSTATGDPTSIRHCDLVLLTVKSFATQAAAESVAHLVSEHSPLLFIQTGLGNQAILRRLFPVEHILAGLTFMSGTTFGDCRVRQGQQGLTFIGELHGEISPRIKEIVDVFNDCGIQTKWSHKIIGRLWAKVITYATLNTMTSVLRVTNGRLLEKEESLSLVQALLNEGECVARAHGVPPLDEDLFQLFEQVCKESANNLSSMLQDIINDHPTEIQAQSGAICRYAQQYNVEAPRHQTMVNLVSLLEQWRPGMSC